MLSPAQIANLPAGKVLVIRRGLAPVVGRVQPAWRRRDVRTHHHAAVLAARAAEAAALDAAAAEPSPVPVPVAVPGEDGWEIPADWFADTALPARPRPRR